MSVQKPDFNSLIKEEIPFTIIPNYVLQNISNPLALSIWCYLISLPNDLEVRKSHLMKHFNLDINSINDAIKIIKDSDLIKYLQSKIHFCIKGD
jgi:hypothetical protein